MELVAAGAFAPGARPAGSSNVETHLVCGCFRFEATANNVLLSALPAVIHTRDVGSDAGLWLAQTIKLLAFESHVEQPGASTVTQRLCDALFVFILRSHLAALPPEKASWLRALVDPQIGVALRSIHEAPGEPWTVAKLASRVGMSRSAFALRFAEHVGETPMQYLIRWRVQKAAGIMRAPGAAALTAIAAEVGYGSEAAFNKAFKRLIGIAPGAYRQGAVGR
jgi:AraC-like DNA-binding protein